MENLSVKNFFANEDGCREFFLREGFIHLKSVFSTAECANAINTIKDFESSLDYSNTVELVTENIDGNVLTKYFQGAYKLGDSLRKFFSRYQIV